MRIFDFIKKYLYDRVVFFNEMETLILTERINASAELKSQLIDKACIAVEKDPFVILNWDKQILNRNWPIEIIISQRKEILNKMKECSIDEKQQIIDRRLSALYRYVSNFTENEVFQLVSSGTEMFNLNENSLAVLKSFDSKTRMKAFAQRGENLSKRIIQYLYPLSQEEISFFINLDGNTLIWLNQINPNLNIIANPELRKMAIIAGSSWTPTELLLPNLTEDEFNLIIKTKPEHVLRDIIPHLNQSIPDSCLFLLLNKHTNIFLENFNKYNHFKLSKNKIQSIIDGHNPRDASLLLKHYPQDIETCIQILEKWPESFSSITLVDGENQSEKLLKLKEKLKILKLIS